MLCPVMEPAVAVMVEVWAAPPAAMVAPVARPLVLMLAPVVAVQATDEVMSFMVPSLKVPVAVNWAVLPVVTPVVGAEVVTVIEVNPGIGAPGEVEPLPPPPHAENAAISEIANPNHRDFRISGLLQSCFF
jgi:hypothetical protein